MAASPDCASNLTCTTATGARTVIERAKGPDLAVWQQVPIDHRGGPSARQGPPSRLTDPTVGLDFVLIPAACYSPPGVAGAVVQGATPVCLDAFYLGAHEVTFGAFDQFAGETSRSLPDDEGWGRGNRPAINVNVYDALSFARWLSRQSGAHYRLPTETEWEHAARAGTKTLYPWGDTLVPGLANCDGCGSVWDGKSTAPVGYFPANSWGLHDMIGNVGEWTCSMRDPKPDLSFTRCDGAYETRRRVYRNGGWSDPPARLTSAFRDWNAAVRRTDDVGFRLVRECPECRPEVSPDRSRSIAGHRD